ncbi:MAG: 5'-3' exonuclease, partial [Fusobacteriaceae bacterium]
MKRAILLDTSAIMYRAFYANSHFRTKNEPTGAVYGFVNTLLRIIADFNPQYIVAAFDVSRKSLKRTEMYSGYKAARDAAPEDLITQIPRIESLLDCFGIKRIKIEGHEADDVLGSLAKKLSGEVDEVIVITGDKDLAQIMDGNIKVALLGKGEGGEGFKVLSTPEDVIEHLGVTPDKIPDLFGLIGDTSDGIPGVRKIGVKKAVPMLEKYGNLEGIYENLDKLTELPGIGKSLINNLMEDKE